LYIEAFNTIMKKQFITTGIIISCIVLLSSSGQLNKIADLEHLVPGADQDPISAYLSPEESMKTMVLPQGYRIELVASEPMVKEPVAIAWDGNARMYVAEMMTYMQDADATGEQEPASRISLLEDTDNDGKMDKSTVFIDSLLLPRMIQCVNHELLVNETNTITIHSYKDTNGDGRADVKKVVYKNDKYQMSDRNMEHQRSGLDWNLDNWMYITYDPVRFRYTNGKLIADTLASGTSGQWGVTHDNYGRLFFSSAGGENPVYGFQINPVYGRLEFPDQFKPEFQEVWPIIPTPDVQGGEFRLRPDRTLNHFTGCSGQSIYRGDQLPEDMVGDYIVCEPVARLIRRAKVKTVNGKTYLENAYNKKEFLASSDMNFRPVNSYTGPDGNLYIVDMHRGIIQQGNWTRPGSFLRKKIDSIGLAKNTGHGRIYRVVHDKFQPTTKPRMLDEASSTLVNYLSHANGWWRDNAQKELIVRGDKSVVPALKAVVNNANSTPLGRIHSLWTLEGLNAMDKTTLFKALSDKDATVRRTAVWISEMYIKKQDETVIKKLSTLANDPDDDVKVQLVLSLSYGKSPLARATVNRTLEANAEHQMITSVKRSVERNEDQRNYGKKLAHLPQRDISIIINGKSIFKSLCASCHGPDGKGLLVAGSKAAPSLIGSKRLADKNPDDAIRILLHGLSGPVDGKTYSSIMPPMGSNNDRWVSSVLSYVRYEMVPTKVARPSADFIVMPEAVKKIRDRDSTRTNPWTLAELSKLNP
jgi:glucose/arabinose dehydrogenase/mono/diheme cytochrome c family protein